MKTPEGKKTIFVQVDERLHGEFKRLCKERRISLQGGVEVALVNEIEVAAGRNPRAVQGSAEKDRVIGRWLEISVARRVVGGGIEDKKDREGEEKKP